jgi:hypothetical protein
MEEIKKVEEVKKVDVLANQLKKQTWQTETGVFNPIIYQQFKVMAGDMARAGALPTGLNAEQALVIMQFGSELGIKPFTALQSIYIVKGKLVLYGSMVISRLTEDGYRVDYEDKVSDKDDENSCTVTVIKGNEVLTETYTFEMARKSGYTMGQSGIKAGWVVGTNRKLKLRYGAVSTLLKTKLPHLLNGAEIKEVWEDVEPIKIAGVETVELSNEDIAKIEAVKTAEELVKVCQELKKSLGKEYEVALLKHYNTKKEELSGNN